jgi:hypothetical protein
MAAADNLKLQDKGNPLTLTRRSVNNCSPIPILGGWRRGGQEVRVGKLNLGKHPPVSESAAEVNPLFVFAYCS